MSIVFIFVNDNGEVIEHFLGVVHVNDTSTQTLKNSIDDFFAINGLSISQLRGQGYDGASNMRVLVTTTKKNGHVCTFFEYLAMIVNVVGASCKRKDVVLQKHHDDLVKRIESGEVATGKGKNEETSLARPGDTRWGSHFKTITRILDMWDAVTHVLDTIFEDGNEPNSRGIARGLIENMNKFEFVFIAHLMVDVLAETNTLSMCLQQKIQNIVTAVRMIKTVKDELKKYGNDDDCWEELLGVITAFCTKNNIFVPNMQDPKLGQGRAKLYRSVDGHPKTYYHFFRRDLF
ncbi:hypothetical protein M9H77_34579 [Catharanthus roseus]|uniref:Uncharacterized protein n=1 Tax=Catharanthus roseus TaxID=4058 RepID=A0ACB9ZLK4_CATRO|nr:hypothetical protein M9H77_34579 [Catharanthus roseus]